VTGAGRTAEELEHAFPGTPVVVSGGANVVDTVPPAPALVVATPGAEPRADAGYAAAVLLDGWALLGRPSLRAAEEALRRWLNAAALVRPGSSGGAVTVVAEDGEAARRVARSAVAIYLDVVGPLDPTITMPADGPISDDVLNRFAMAGTPDQVAEQARALFDAGARRVEFGSPHGLTAEEGIRLLGERVLPRLR